MKHPRAASRHPLKGAAPAFRRRQLGGTAGLGYLLLGTVGTLLVLVIAGILALWLWAGRPGSLPQALDWATEWSQAHPERFGTLEVSGASGGLRGEGRIGTLRWRHDGLEVQVADARLPWDDGFWLGALAGRGLHLPDVEIGSLHIIDQRPPSPAGEPLQQLVLPLPLSLSWRIGTLTYGSDAARPALTLAELRGHYRYGPFAPDAAAAPAMDALPAGEAAHQIGIDHVRLAQGSYRAQAVLGARAPMPLRLHLGGDLAAPRPDGSPLPLQAEASVDGSLAGVDALLHAQAQVRPADGANQAAEVALKARADIAPWERQALPLRAADIDAQGLDLALFWPDAPRTAIAGTLHAAPDGGRWQARVDLRNGIPGPWDKAALPLESLRAELALQDGRWTVSGLDSQIGGGRLQLQGHADTGADGQLAVDTLRWQARARLDAIDPSRLWQGLAPQRISGEARAGADEPGTIAFEADLKTQAAAGTAAGRRPLIGPTQVKGTWQADGQRLRIDKASTAVADARLDAQGEADFAAHRVRMDASAQAPGLRIALDGRQGTPQDGGRIDLQLADAQALQRWWNSLASMPLIGPAVQGWLDAARPWSDGQLSGSARLQMQWQGAWPVPGWTAAGPDRALPRLDGELSAPRLQLRDTQERHWSVEDLRLQARGPLDRLQLDWTARAGQGPWALAAAGQAQWPQAGSQAAAWPPASGQLRIDRLTLDHAPAVAAPSGDTAPLPPGTAELSAPLDLRWQTGDRQAWVVDAGTGKIEWRWRQAGQAAPALLSWDALRWDAGVLVSRGQLAGLSMAWIDALSDTASDLLARAGLGGDLQMGADWDISLPISAPGEWRLAASLHRTGGDLTVRANSGPRGSGNGNGNAVPAQVREARLNIALQGETAQARLRWDSEHLGSIEGELGTRIDPRAGELAQAWPESAALQGSVQARMPQVGVWSALAPPGWRVRGALAAQVQIGGTRARPDWRGQLQADDLAVFSMVDGIAFRNGRLRATADGQHVSIDSLHIEGPRGAAEGGTLDATGVARWREQPARAAGDRPALWPDITLQAKADKLRVSARPDRRLVLSGEVNTQLSGDQLQVRGQLHADEALFILPDEFTPSLGADVVVRGGLRQDAGGASDEPGRQIHTDARIDIDLGRQFEVRGRGLQAMLGGRLEVRSTPADPTPRVLGDVGITQGSYRAYGQQLRIETGTLRFTGPYDDPTLDIAAVRPQGSSDQRVGVRVSGSAQSPTIRLFAEPDMPDSEKLAWLVLGRPATGTGAEAAILQQAALALLSSRGQGQDLGNQLARNLGVDDISLQGQSQNTDGTVNAAAVSIGKRLSDKLYISYERSLIGTLGTVSMFYELTRFLTLRGRAGEENAVDLVFTRRYD